MPNCFEHPAYLKIILKFHTSSLLIYGILWKQKQKINNQPTKKPNNKTFPPPKSWPFKNYLKTESELTCM